MRSLDKKMRELENRVLEPVTPGSTKLCIDLFPEAEKALFERYMWIIQNMDASTWDDETSQVLEQGYQRLNIRVIDLFESWLKAFFNIRQNADKNFIITIRFWYFMFELGRHLEQVEAEHTLKGKKLKEWYKNQEDKPRLWTHESFSYFWNNYIAKACLKTKKSEK